jgi:predicted transcriptional regulator
MEYDEDDDGWLEVVNIEKLINFSRKLIYYNFDEENAGLADKEFLDKVSNIDSSKDSAEIDSVLPYKECKNIITPLLKKKISKKTDKVKYLIKESDYDEVLIQFNQRMVSNIIQNLVKKGYLDTAYDSEKNDFVFWVKEKLG